MALVEVAIDKECVAKLHAFMHEKGVFPVMPAQAPAPLPTPAWIASAPCQVTGSTPAEPGPFAADHRAAQSGYD